jgi:hypothetical protein
MNTPTSLPSPARNRLMLILIAGAFVLPIVIAWLLASGKLDWQPDILSNHGTLISPPIDLADMPGSDAAQPLRALPPADWALLFVSDQPCDAPCQAVLRELAAVRMVIGKNGTRVNVFGVFTAAQATGDVRQIVDPALVRAIGDRLTAGGNRLGLPFIGFLDWRGQLMMHFAPDAAPDDIKSDLKRLLSASAIK